MTEEYIKIKGDYSEANTSWNEMRFVCPQLFHVFSVLCMEAHKRNLPVVITRVFDGRIGGISTSDTHQEYRAIDISVRGWTPEEATKITDILNLSYGYLWGTSRDGKNSRVCVYHKGTALHFHLQVRRGL